MFGFSCSEASVRPPAVAGAFYPGTAQDLRRDVEKMLGSAEDIVPDVRAAIVPHAGYIYSGPTAARAFRSLEGKKIGRIFLLGPSHRMAFSGAALPAKGIAAFSTPLGEVALDGEVVEELRKSALFSGPSRAHDGEHSLEVQLPFLQIVCPEARIVPILIGASTARGDLEKMARALAEFTGEGTVVIASSDFTHHGASYGWAPFAGLPDVRERLERLCRKTAEIAADIQPEAFHSQVQISGDTVCGRDPITILLYLLAHAFEGKGHVVGLSNSGQLTGDWSRQSVSYAAIVFEGKWRKWAELPRNKEEQDLEASVLVPALARAVLQSHLGHGPEVAEFFLRFGRSPILNRPAGAFVTLNHKGIKAGEPGRLRACMGMMDASQKLLDAVIEAALSASRDPRFPPLSVDELPDLDIEVSILSPRHAVDSVRDIRIGRDGILLSKNGRQAVFLPQVAVEQGWDLPTTLSHLSRKAGLSSDAWRHGAHFEVFTADIYSEGGEKVPD